MQIGEPPGSPICFQACKEEGSPARETGCGRRQCDLLHSGVVPVVRMAVPLSPALLLSAPPPPLARRSLRDELGFALRRRRCRARRDDGAKQRTQNHRQHQEQHVSCSSHSIHRCPLTFGSNTFPRFIRRGGLRITDNSAGFAILSLFEQAQHRLIPSRRAGRMATLGAGETCQQLFVESAGGLRQHHRQACRT